ncbi:hypothetical protein TL16_g03013 [Triparma laevis f. inornata]|uniref:Uncharacterized protein n=2 Tax=Triparma laevis TaxID=1534972 RepID=A0A9W7FST1_9STRA|nr:hypothetical protein TL16_g03013 [Triparma laevis f. inornata]GMI17579.1 hypothetical protein TrLO_g3923 [Triparma laevis f. longispina]
MSSACPFHPLLLSYQERPLLTYTVSLPSCPNSDSKLTICTKSLVLITQSTSNATSFLPSSGGAVTSNLIKFPYASISSLTTSSNGNSVDTLKLTNITSYLLLHPPNAGLSQPVLPHGIIKLPEPFTLSITFQHTSISESTPLFNSLLQLYNGEVKDDNILTQEKEGPTEDEVKRKIYKSVVERKVSDVTPVGITLPLQTLTNHFLICTDQNLYILTPSHTIYLTIPLSKIKRVALRYHKLQDLGLEIFTSAVSSPSNLAYKPSPHDKNELTPTATSLKPFTDDYWTYKCTSSILLTFPTTSSRNTLLSSLKTLTSCVVDTSKSRVSQLYSAYLSNKISNYTYLWLINSAAGRSSNDLSRYPIYPWIRSSDNPPRDLSKPIGAINKSRLEGFKERREGMKDIEGFEHSQFLYGTFYSNAGYSLFWLVRSKPVEVICLQGGCYDHADRMFFDYDKSWRSCLDNNADLKELVPEFFNTEDESVSRGGRFLQNVRDLPLGRLQSGEKVEDVVLPEGVKSCRAFVKKNRKELEEAEIAPWVDLIFGCGQRGEEAERRDNVFVSSVYYTEDDLKHADETTKQRMIMETEEFGVCPDVLFVMEHGKKGEGAKIDGMWMAAVATDSCGRERSVNGTPGRKSDASSIGGSTPKRESMPDNPTTPKPPAPVTPQPQPQTHLQPQPNPPPNSSTKFGDEVAAAKGKAKAWLSSFGLNLTLLHSSSNLHTDSITSVLVTPSFSIFSTSRDGSTKSLTKDLNLVTEVHSSMPVSDATLFSNGSIACSGYDDSLSLYSEELVSVSKFIAHDDATSSVESCSTFDIAYVTGGWDCIVKLWIKEECKVELYDCEEAVVNVEAREVSGGAILVIAGEESGKGRGWIVTREGGQKVVGRINGNAIKMIHKEGGDKRFLTGGSDGVLNLYEYLEERGNSAGSFVKIASTNVHSGVRVIDTDGKHAIVGCSDGGLRVCELHEDKIVVTKTFSSVGQNTGVSSLKAWGGEDGGAGIIVGTDDGHLSAWRLI